MTCITFTHSLTYHGLISVPHCTCGSSQPLSDETATKKQQSYVQLPEYTPHITSPSSHLSEVFGLRSSSSWSE